MEMTTTIQNEIDNYDPREVTFKTHVDNVLGLRHGGYYEIDSHVEARFGRRPKHYVAVSSPTQSGAFAIFDDGSFASVNDPLVVGTIVDLLNQMTPEQRLEWCKYSD